MRKTLVINQANAYARLTDFKPELVHEVLMPFCKRNFYRFQKVPGEVFGTTKWEVSHVFARFNHDKTELRFNASMINPLIDYMVARGYNKSRIDIVEEKVIKPKKITLELRDDSIKPRNEIQEDFTKFMIESLGMVTNNMGTGQGKSQPLSALVKIPGGWTIMGDIKVGDTVIAHDGTEAKVLNIYPQGELEVYRITFADGREVETSGDHLWKTHSSITDTWGIITTKDILAGLSNPDLVTSVPLCQPEQSVKEQLWDELNYRVDVFEGRIFELYLRYKEAASVRDLIFSLGGTCTIQYVNGAYELRGNIGVTDKLQILKVEQVESEQCQCISIDHPDRLYVTNDHIVTHNTFCALYSSQVIGERILITVLPRYVDIWIKAFGEFYKLHPTDIVLADSFGVPELHAAIKEKRIDPKIIILPLTKIDLYLKKMKEEPETTPCLDQVFEDLECGVRIIDEAHESIFSVHQSLMYGNHKKTMVLSATLRGDDEFVNEIYNQIFPPKSYLRPTEYTQYINVISYQFRMDMWKYKINTKGFGGYNHVKFEQGIMKNKHVFEQYYQMLMGAYKMYYLDEYKEGMKCMWFFATVEFCEMFNERMLKDFPELDSIVFTANISKKQPTAYRDHANVVTTPGSCGTGKDIPMLFSVFSPIAVSSSQRNDQMVGRTRPTDKWWPDTNPNFVYFTCRDEPKQIEYDRKRRSLFGRKAKRIDVIDSCVRI